jgi:hypothetical protein
MSAVNLGLKFILELAAVVRLRISSRPLCRPDGSINVVRRESDGFWTDAFTLPSLD